MFQYIKELLTQDFRRYSLREMTKRLVWLRETWWAKSGKRLVGRDANGNTYWEGNDQYQRTRWVEFSNSVRGRYEPSLVPAEWHQWLHKLRDAPPSKADVEGLFYNKHKTLNSTLSSSERYLPTGHFFNKQRTNVNVNVRPADLNKSRTGKKATVDEQQAK
eukprot:gb/GECH01012487.1/.p1 GENE.gb/GECH01012487.1/~~gb/GECH01012487.1/.p1  ORF type:complete len:161 (+),score=18.27 gb/GECH01012487.1/:1-483(+)